MVHLRQPVRFTPHATHQSALLTLVQRNKAVRAAAAGQDVTTHTTVIVMRQWEATKLVKMFPLDAPCGWSGLSPDSLARRDPNDRDQFLFAKFGKVSYVTVRNSRQALTRLIAYMHARGLDWEDRFGMLAEINLFAFLMVVHVEALHPLGTPCPRQPNNPDRRVPFHHSANLINMPQVGMFRNEDGTLRIPQWNCTLSGTPLAPELHPYEPEAGLPQIFTPWSENETQLMNGLFPNPVSLCLNFGRTGVFQWNQPNSSIMTQTTEWPQSVAVHTLRSCEMAGITHTRGEPHPHMPYVIFRDMGPHFDSYANSGIPNIIGTNHELY